MKSKRVFSFLTAVSLLVGGALFAQNDELYPLEDESWAFLLLHNDPGQGQGSSPDEDLGM